VESSGRFRGLCPKSTIESDFCAAPGSAIEDLSTCDRYSEHFFECDALGTQLHPITRIRLRPSSLELDRDYLPPARRPRKRQAGGFPVFALRKPSEFNHVGPSTQPEREASQVDAAQGAKAAPVLIDALVDSLVKDPSFSRKSVLDP